jgi:hypothetical protein
MPSKEMMYITSKAVSKVEKRAFNLITREDAQQEAIRKANKSKETTEDEKERVNKGLKWITQNGHDAIENYEFAAQALDILHQAIRSVHTESEIDLMSPEAAQLILTLSVHRLKAADHPDCSNAARYIGDRLEGLTLATADFYEKQLALCEHYPQDLVAAYQYIQSHLDEARAGKLMAEVERSLGKRHRASSAIEGFNSLLRPYMYVRKGVSQGFLELFQAWHNL